MIYIEMERADARERRSLVTALEANLKDVRAAVGDWVRAAGGDGGRCRDADRRRRGAAATGSSTAISPCSATRRFGREAARARRSAFAATSTTMPILAEASRALAIKWFEEGDDAPLLLKSNLISSVHRHVPLDLVVVPMRDGKKVTGLSIHAGLWTSAALNTPPDDVPVLRTRLAELQKKFGFDPKGHAGKALDHALTDAAARSADRVHARKRSRMSR